MSPESLSSWTLDTRTRLQLSASEAEAKVYQRGRQSRWGDSGVPSLTDWCPASPVCQLVHRVLLSALNTICRLPQSQSLTAIMALDSTGEAEHCASLPLNKCTRISFLYSWLFLKQPRVSVFVIFVYYILKLSSPLFGSFFFFYQF